MAYQETNRLHPIVTTPNRKASHAAASKKKMASNRSFNATDSRESSSVSKNGAAASRVAKNNQDIDAVFTRHEGGMDEAEAAGDKHSNRGQKRVTKRSVVKIP